MPREGCVAAMDGQVPAATVNLPDLLKACVTDPGLEVWQVVLDVVAHERQFNFRADLTRIVSFSFTRGDQCARLAENGRKFTQ
jgi:hypothetical protein